MKALGLISALILTGCARPPVKTSSGWTPVSWEYRAHGNLCGYLSKHEDIYEVVIVDADGKPLFRDQSKYGSDQEAQRLMEVVCDNRAR